MADLLPGGNLVEELKFREFRGDDIFLLLPFLAKLGITDEIVSVMNGAAVAPKVPVFDRPYEELNDEEKSEFDRAKKDQEVFLETRGQKIIAQLINKALLNLPSIRGDVNELIASATGKTAAEIGGLPLKAYLNVLIRFFSQPSILEAFTSAASLIGFQAASTSSETSSGADTAIQSAS